MKVNNSSPAPFSLKGMLGISAFFFCAGISIAVRVYGVRTAEGEAWLHKRSWTSWKLCNRLRHFPVNHFRSLETSDADWFEKWVIEIYYCILWLCSQMAGIREVMKDCWDWSLWGKRTAIESGPMMIQSIQVIDVDATSKTLHWPPRILCCPTAHSQPMLLPASIVFSAEILISLIHMHSSQSASSAAQSNSR